MLLDALERAVHADPDVEYEIVINSQLEQIEVGFVNIGDLPWLEIDFPSDVERARKEIWPQIRAGETAPSR